MISNGCDIIYNMKGARVQSDPKASKLNESLLAYRSRSKEVINRIK